MSSPYVILVGTVMSVIVLLVCSYCYFRTIMEIRVATKKASIIGAVPKNNNNNPPRGRQGSTMARSISDSRSSEIEARVTKKVMGYILVFILQWFPTIPYDIYEFLDINTAWVYVLVVIAINMGGIGNAVCYVLNEGWSLHSNNSSLNTEERGDTGRTLSSNVKNKEKENNNSVNSTSLQEHFTETGHSQAVMINDDQQDLCHV
ncbi:300_t:CDS:2 [Acaulospora colombiana]|uniref:300_t:CDS:1 n=1 Tax=Acaulospora colombiana TaxID=27376 RepID=A0ACA9LYU0_9GLOM|nr:300_t:CDS:2 [Acaulospora colombiana]